MMKKLLALLGASLLMVSCAKTPQFHGLTVKATEWPLHDTRVCVFFGTGSTTKPIVGCWENEDNGKYFNAGDRDPDHLYLVDALVPSQTFQKLSEGHNEVVHCYRSSYTQITCE